MKPPTWKRVGVLALRAGGVHLSMGLEADSYAEVKRLLPYRTWSLGCWKVSSHHPPA